MTIREGRWDCPSCGSTGVYGRHVDCPGCGKPRPAGTRFYLTDDAPAITDPARLAEARAGADWVCGHCGASNRALLDACGGCGAARALDPSPAASAYAGRPGDDGAGAGEPLPPDASASAAVQASGWTQPAAPAEPAIAPPDGGSPSAAAGPPAPPKRPSGWRLGALCVAVIVLLSWCDRKPPPYTVLDYAAMEEKPQPAVVIDKRWERRIEIQERRIEQGTAFHLPDSAEVLGQERVVERYDSVQDGWRTVYRDVEREEDVTTYETRTRDVEERVQTGSYSYSCQRDLGNGYFEESTCSAPSYETRTRTESYSEPVTRRERRTRSEGVRVPRYRAVPVYGTLYRFRRPVWVSVESAEARGDTAAPAWPELPVRPNQRLWPRAETYTLTLDFPAWGVKEVQLPQAEWERYRIGQGVAVRQTSYNEPPLLLPADSLPACRVWHEGAAPMPPDSLGCSPRPVPVTADSPRAAGTPAVRADPGAQRPRTSQPPG